MDSSSFGNAIWSGILFLLIIAFLAGAGFVGILWLIFR